MTWQFEVKGLCPIFASAVCSAPPNSQHTFVSDGRYDVIEPMIIRPHHVSALISGSSTTTIPGYGSYESVDFADDSPLHPGKQMGPYSAEAYAQAGPTGALYVCFSAPEGVKLDYDVMFGPHEYRAPSTRTYAVLVQGQAEIQGTPAKRWKPIELSPQTISSVVDATQTAIVFYIWDRVTLPEG